MPALSADDRRLFLIERSAVTYAVASLIHQARVQAQLEKGDAAAAEGDLKTASACYRKAISLT